jgi:hypothetical protein
MAAFLIFQKKKLKISACGFYEFNRFATFLVNFMQERNISTRTTCITGIIMTNFCFSSKCVEIN